MHASMHDRIRIKRVYEPADPADGYRVLVDRLWPRGVGRDAAALQDWMKALGPSTALRQWFGHEPARWHAFVDRYRQELAAPAAREMLEALAAQAAQGPVTLVYGAKDARHNQAVVIADLLREIVGENTGGTTEGA